MLLLRFRTLVLSVALGFGANAITAQNYPSKPIRIVTSGVGGGNDFAARLLATALTSNLGQQVVVENRPGASGIIAAQTVSNAAPDGYSLLLYTGSIWTLPFLRSNVPYDPVADFSPITLALSSPNIIVLHPSLPVRTVKDLIALARSRPGELNNAGGESGSTTHLAAVLFNTLAHVNIVQVPYKSGAIRISDLMAGHVQLMFATAGSVTAHIKSGRLKALAVTSAQPSALFPGLPTVASALPAYEAVSTIALFAPAKTPASIIGRLNQEIVRVINQPDIKEKLLNNGVEAVGSSPQQAATYIKADMTKWGKLIKSARIKEE